MKQKYKRLQFILISIIFISIGLWLILKNFNQNIVFFYTPSEIKAKHIINQVMRVGGLVKKKSISKSDNELTTVFTLTDQKTDITVSFTGLLPNLFREGQGIVAKGSFDGKKFIDEELLTKHDENYIPKEIIPNLNNN